MNVTGPTIRFDIYMAGDIAQARQVCREFCYSHGECVHLEPVEFIYTGGEEVGFKVGFINYPRFPRDEDAIHVRAVALAHLLLERLCQHSFSLVGKTTTEYFSRRDGASS